MVAEGAALKKSLKIAVVVIVETVFDVEDVVAVDSIAAVVGIVAVAAGAFVVVVVMVLAVVDLAALDTAEELVLVMVKIARGKESKTSLVEPVASSIGKGIPFISSGLLESKDFSFA